MVQKTSFPEKVTPELSQRVRRPPPGEDLGEKYSRQRDQHVREPRGRNELGVFEDRKGGQCAWSTVESGGP